MGPWALSHAHVDNLPVQAKNKKSEVISHLAFSSKNELFRYFHAFVVTAAWANAVREFVLTAIVAFYHAWNL